MSESHGPPGPGTTQRLPVARKPYGEDTTTAGATGESTPYEGRARRFWSARRWPAAVMSLLVFCGSGLLLYDIVAVRSGRSAMQWRKSLAHELAVRSLDDAGVLTGAAVAAALGLWLLFLAATPGQRGLLPMRRAHADVRAALHRSAATLVLRDRAMEVSGVRSARVRTRRRSVKVRALAHFRELDDVRTDVHTALADGIRDLGLARPPALSVHVARPDRKG